MSSYISIIKRLPLWCCILLFAACQNNYGHKAENAASLHLLVRSTGQDLRTRGVEDLNDDGNVSENEIIVDGRKIYRLAVFLFEGNRIITSTVLEADDQRFANGNTEAAISFKNLDYSKTYRLYAVANYGNYDGLEGKLAEVYEENVASGLSVSASGNNICDKQTPYPLTFTKEINLTPGANVVSGELLRTYARIRINVRNQSSLNDLHITELSFPTNFTQRSSDIFVEGGTADVSPVVTSEEAVTPFEEEKLIPRIDASGNVSEATIFDTYLLESNGGNYNYTLGLKYEGGTEEVYTVSGSAIRSASNIEDGAMYVIYNTNARRYLYADNATVKSGGSYLSDGELDHNYVWKFNRTASNQYTIESMGTTGYFMQSSQVSYSGIPLTVAPGASDYFTASTSGTNIRFKSTSGNYYIGINGSTVYGNSSTSNSALRRNNFNLYKVEKSQVTNDITHKETIPICTIDKTTGEALPITAIRRNDFIDILVNVTYNDKTGDVMFEVAGWEEINGDVTFE
ncbi:MAG: hypothetical protein IJY44_00090 [Bacteroidaceae bacterium]|nr:hypothetical protein [Bacteroidaceae bacterium]